MNKYFIIREDGSSIFALPYPKDFCIHCLLLLIDDGQSYRLLSCSELISLPCYGVTALNSARSAYLGG